MSNNPFGPSNGDSFFGGLFDGKSGGFRPGQSIRASTPNEVEAIRESILADLLNDLILSAAKTMPRYQLKVAGMELVLRGRLEDCLKQDGRYMMVAIAADQPAETLSALRDLYRLFGQDEYAKRSVWPIKADATALVKLDD